MVYIQLNNKLNLENIMILWSNLKKVKKLYLLCYRNKLLHMVSKIDLQLPLN
jgi:hypothetical protein